MKIVLIYPPYSLKEEFGKLEEVGNLQQPLGLAYLAAVLEKERHQVKIIDAPPLGYTISDIIREVKDFSPDVVGLTTVTVDFYKAIKIACQIKKNLGCPVIIGGPHLTADPENSMKQKCFDYGIIGEGEKTIIELVEKIRKNDLENLDKIKGIIYRHQGKIIKTQPRPFIKNLDTIPFPARHLLPPLEKYHPTPASYKKLPVGSITTSRGCPFQCIFCDRSIFGNNYRFRSPKNVVDELEILVRDFGAQEVRFWDDTFNANPERVVEICQEMIKRKLDIPWTCLARVNFVDQETLGWMKKAGCWQISYGIESGNPEVLKIIKKGLTKEMVRQALKLTKKAGIGIRGFFIFGLPGDTKKTMQETIDFAKSLSLDVANFYITMPFPGTELYREGKNWGAMKKIDYDKYLVNLPEELAYIPKGLDSKTIKEFERRAYREFYRRPKYLFSQFLQIKSLREFLEKIKAFLVISKIK